MPLVMVAMEVMALSISTPQMGQDMQKLSRLGKWHRSTVMEGCVLIPLGIEADHTRTVFMILTVKHRSRFET